MKYILIGLFIFCQNMAYAQYKIIAINESGDTIQFPHLRGHVDKSINGKIIHFFGKNIITEAWQKNGRFYGLCRFYYYSGEIEKEGMMHDSREVGLWVEYHRNGNPKVKGCYTDGKPTGIWYYYDEEGKLIESRITPSSEE